MKNQHPIKNFYLNARETEGQYIRLPERLAEKIGSGHLADEFGSSARLEFIRKFIKTLSGVKRVIDIAGNCGYFSLSLIDEGLVEASTVFDINKTALEFGTQAASHLGHVEKCRFEEKKIGLDNLDELPSGELVLCQNFIHHAGAMYDEDQVSRLGMDDYMVEFLRRLAAKYPHGVIGMGFKGSKPVGWNVDKRHRKHIFHAHLNQAGWKVVSDGNVQSLVDNGSTFPFFDSTPMDVAAGRKSGFQKIVQRLAGTRPPEKKSKAANYHIYCVTRSRSIAP